MGKNKKSSRANAVLNFAGRKTRKYLKRALITALVAAPIIGTSIWAKWAYQVKTNYGAVITEAGGDRVAVTEPGWHLRMPFLSTYEKEYALANQMLHLLGKKGPHKKPTKDGKVILVSADTFYRITDLRQYAIENVTDETSTIFSRKIFGIFSIPLEDTVFKTPKDMIQQIQDSIIISYIQKTEAERLLYDRSEVGKEILEKLVNSGLSETYGIEIDKFYLRITEPLPEVVTANAEGQAKAIHAEAEAAYYKRMEEAFNPQTLEERADVREKFVNIVKYRTMREREADTTWIMEGNSSRPVFDPQKKQPLKDSEKQHE